MRGRNLRGRPRFQRRFGGRLPHPRRTAPAVERGCRQRRPARPPPVAHLGRRRNRLLGRGERRRGAGDRVVVARPGRGPHRREPSRRAGRPDRFDRFGFGGQRFAGGGPGGDRRAGQTDPPGPVRQPADRPHPGRLAQPVRPRLHGLVRQPADRGNPGAVQPTGRPRPFGFVRQRPDRPHTAPVGRPGRPDRFGFGRQRVAGGDPRPFGPVAPHDLPGFERQLPGRFHPGGVEPDGGTYLAGPVGQRPVRSLAGSFGRPGGPGGAGCQRQPADRRPQPRFVGFDPAGRAGPVRQPADRFGRLRPGRRLRILRGLRRFQGFHRPVGGGLRRRNLRGRPRLQRRFGRRLPMAGSGPQPLGGRSRKRLPALRPRPPFLGRGAYKFLAGGDGRQRAGDQGVFAGRLPPLADAAERHRRNHSRLFAKPVRPHPSAVGRQPTVRGRPLLHGLPGEPARSHPPVAGRQPVVRGHPRLFGQIDHPAAADAQPQPAVRLHTDVADQADRPHPPAAGSQSVVGGDPRRVQTVVESAAPAPQRQ